MNLDANPPRAGEKTGVQSPAQKTNTLPPTGAAPVPAAATHPYARLSLTELMEKFADKPQEERIRLIREIKGISPPEKKSPAPPPSDPPDPLAGLSAVAKRLREKIAETPGNDETALETDIAAMRALFTDLLHNTGKEVDLKFGLTVALRAQKQALDAFLGLRRLELLENKQNPPGGILKK